MSATVFAAVEGLDKVGVHVTTSGAREYESELMVYYHKSTGEDQTSPWFHHEQDMNIPFRFQKAAQTLAQQVAYPVGEPQAMIQAITSDRQTLNMMEAGWAKGAIAAKAIYLEAEAMFPYNAEESEIYYVLKTLVPRNSP
jgi:hypothetical protein